MQMIGRMNEMLEKGWKLTDVTCPKCNGTTMAEPKDQIDTLYCPKQDQQFPYEFEQLVPEAQGAKEAAQTEEERYFKEVVEQMNKQKAEQQLINNKAQKQRKQFDEIYLNQKESQALNRTNDVSKKIGQKLLQGWAMLNQSCNNCYAPIMRSKSGQKVCFGCDRDFTVKKEEQNKTPEPVVVKPKVQQNKRLEVQRVQKTPQIQAKPIEVKVQKKENPQLSGNKISYQKAIAREGRSCRTIIDRIEERSLLFLQSQLKKAEMKEDLVEMERILQLVYKIKNEFQ